VLNRRDILGVTLGLGAGCLLRPALAASVSYDQAVRETWAPLGAPLQTGPRQRELVRAATLAANSHNTQPWIFTATANTITIAPDFDRRCPAVDPDDHHLFVSLGCATENLVLAAAAIGLGTTTTFADDSVTIGLESGPSVRSSLYDAITVRQCTRAPFDRRPVSAEPMRLLESAGRESGVGLILLTDKTKIAEVADYVVQGNTAQMHDAAFMTELKSWLRFSETDAVATRDGLFARASGNPAMPSWLARAVLPLVFTVDGENRKYRDHIESSAGIAVLVSDTNDKAHWVAAGRACQRFALQATALGLKYAFVNQPVEVPALRRQFATYLGLGERRPDLVLRFGAGPELPRSLRRPPEQVMRQPP
jgi:nitroreductase